MYSVFVTFQSPLLLLCVSVFMSALHHFTTSHCFYYLTMLCCRAQSCYGKLSVYPSVCDVGVPSLYIIMKISVISSLVAGKESPIWCGEVTVPEFQVEAGWNR